MPKKKKFYAVAIGRKPGVYNAWDECEKQTKGFSGARFKSFRTIEEAQAFINGGTKTAKAAIPNDSKRQDTESTNKRPAKRQRTESQPRTPRTGVTIEIYFDGGSRGNPGASGAGAYIESNGQMVKVRKYLGTNATNNFAEYHGLICGLKEAKNIIATTFDAKKGNETIHVHVRGDSDLIIRQMKGTYQCKSANLIPLHREAKSLVAEIKQLAPVEVTFEHVYREDNSLADALANEAMDTGRSWTTTEELDAHITAGSSQNNDSEAEKDDKSDKNKSDVWILDV